MHDNTAVYEWNTRIDREFLLAAKELTIFLKDGFSFFEQNADVLAQRFEDTTKKTRVIIVHPDSPYMVAIAAMDPQKRGNVKPDPFVPASPSVQKDDCIRAVRAMHGIRKKLQDAGKGDCSERVSFTGSPFVPTWNGFISEEKAVINEYPARPFRGPLIASMVPPGNIKYEDRLTDCNELIREVSKNPVSNLWEYKL